eukprot:1796910-Prymnesium_polylepis.1
MRRRGAGSPAAGRKHKSCTRGAAPAASPAHTRAEVLDYRSRRAPRKPPPAPPPPCAPRRSPSRPDAPAP